MSKKLILPFLVFLVFVSCTNKKETISYKKQVDTKWELTRVKTGDKFSDSIRWSLIMVKYCFRWK